MNFITHSHAYSLYARATFGERRSVPSKANKARDVAARKKYHDQGWKTVGVAPDDPAVEFHDILRRVGDKHCWVIPLDHPSDNKGQSEDDDLVGSHTWKMDFFKKKGPLMAYHIFRSSHLINKYCVTEEVASVIAKTPLGYGNDEEDHAAILTGADIWSVINNLVRICLLTSLYRDYDLLKLVKHLFDEDSVPRKDDGASEDDQPKSRVRMQDLFV